MKRRRCRLALPARLSSWGGTLAWRLSSGRFLERNRGDIISILRTVMTFFNDPSFRSEVICLVPVQDQYCPEST